jgi:hypothetical protein
MPVAVDELITMAEKQDGMGGRAQETACTPDRTVVHERSDEGQSRVKAVVTGGAKAFG